jgi:hypothetical protein
LLFNLLDLNFLNKETGHVCCPVSYIDEELWMLQRHAMIYMFDMDGDGMRIAFVVDE